MKLPQPTAGNPTPSDLAVTATRSQRLLLLVVRLLFLVLLVSISMLTIAGRASGPQEFQLQTFLGVLLASAAVGTIVIVLDAMTPNKRLSSVVGVYMGICFGLIAAVAVSSEEWYSRNPAIVSIGAPLHSVPSAYVAQLAEAASTTTVARSSVVKSRDVPSSKKTVTVTSELTGTEIGGADALSSDDVIPAASVIDTDTDVASGTCTCTGATPEPSVAAGHACHSTCTASLQSAAAPTGDGGGRRARPGAGGRGQEDSQGRLLPAAE